MIVVHRPVLTSEGGVLRAAAGIEADGRELISLRFEAESSAPLRMTDSSEPFAALGLALAWRRGVPMHVRGTVSPRFAWGLRELVRVRRAWWPQRAPDPVITFDAIEEPREEQRGSGCGCHFSGGVDSFFTLMRHRPGVETLPGYALTHMVMIDGFDYDEGSVRPGLSEGLRRTYAPLAGRLGIAYVGIRTNMQALRPLVAIGGSWESWLSVQLAAPALLLSPMFGRFYFASGAALYQLRPYGTHPVTDHLLSSSSMQIVHDGAEATRTQKLAALAEWDETSELLRVCRDRSWNNLDLEQGKVRNCGRCMKCLRTMVALAAMKKLGRIRTFVRPLTARGVLLDGPGDRLHSYTRESIRIARRNGLNTFAALLFLRMQIAKVRNGSRVLSTALLRRARSWGSTGPGVG